MLLAKGDFIVVVLKRGLSALTACWAAHLHVHLRMYDDKGVSAPQSGSSDRT